MPEYIDREKAKQHLALDYAYNAAKMLDELPAADVQEVRHGMWTAKSFHEIQCSECKESWDIMTNDFTTFKYCPNCGAKMDKE